MVRDYSSVQAVFPLQTYAITGVSIGADEFVVAGDQRERFLVGGIFVVADSTGNDGTYTIASVSYASAETTIGVSEDVTDATVDGEIIHDEIADELGMTLSHDDSADRDAETPDQVAGAHVQRLTNEIRALARTLGTGIGFAILDGGGLDILFSSGTIIFGSGAPVDGVPGKLTLADDDINYIEVDSAAVVSANVVSFTVGKYPLAIVTTASGAVTDIDNKRSAIYIAEFAEFVHAMGGTQHSADTLANVNTKITDATLDDSGDPRDPNAHVHNADDVNAGELGDARISESSVTQHEAAINHDALLNYLIAQHRIINDAGSSTTELYSASKIASEIAAVAAGVDHKDPVATSTEGLGDITLSGEQTLNGVLTSASRVLVTEQTLPAQNGIYISDGSGWSRSPDADTDAEVTNGLTVWVGDSGSDVYRHHYLLTTPDPITVGTTPLTFAAIPDMEFGTTAGTATEGNDSRVPTQDENDALVGTNGTPSSANKYVTNTDPRNSDARTPVAHLFAGAQHSADTLANLNSKVSDLIPTYGGLRDIGIGTLAQRPSFGTANRFFYTNDEQKIYRDTGSAWEALSGGDFSDGGEAGGADRTLGNTDNFDLGFLTNNLVRLHIQNDGKVGIGTTDPAARFTVEGPDGDTSILVDQDGTGGTNFATGDPVGVVSTNNIIGSVVGNSIWRGFEVASDDGVFDALRIHNPGTVEFNIGLSGTTLFIGETQPSLTISRRFVLDNNGRVGIGEHFPLARLHVDQRDSGATIPVMILDQADISEEMIEFISTIGVGNAIEAVGAKTLTTTHFIKVTLPGALTRYIPVGTIA